MQYPAKCQPDGESFLVTFPDLPEAITGGTSEAEARTNATEALELTLLTYVKDQRALPQPSTPPEDGENCWEIPVSAGTTAKLAFIEAFRASTMTRVALAGKLGKAEGEVRRMLDPYHRTKLGTLEAGLLALGKRLVVTIEEAA
ncbi:MAG TPA: type II toxin-antitoxin system HicB family antitoxin [Devosiaceae bacterium]|nr:type II toxin-antitoxin system HicB family antitoxin [Devosiaceae bacterium]